MKKNQAFLTTVEFHILLALRTESLHGYQVIKQVETDTNGEVSLLTGTLYNAIKRLVEEELIVGVEVVASEQQDSRRKYYQLTEKGRKALGAELSRYEASVRLASSKQFVTLSGHVIA